MSSFKDSIDICKVLSLIKKSTNGVTVPLQIIVRVLLCSSFINSLMCLELLLKWTISKLWPYKYLNKKYVFLKFDGT